jgi:hypothetical protein
MTREPVRIIGILTTVIIAILTALGQEGVISDEVVTNLTNLIVILAPIIAAEIARRLVTPVADPQNNDGVPLIPRA